MTSRGSTFREVVRALAETQETRGAHTTLEEWTAYRRGELPEEESGRLREHLLACSECLDQVLLDPAVYCRSAPQDPHQVSEFELAAARRALRARHEAERLKRWRMPASIAASLLVAALGASTVTAVHHKSLSAELSRPQLNVPIETLENAQVRGEENVDLTVEVPPGASTFTLVLPVGSGDAFTDYRLEILDAEGRQVWSGRGLVVDHYSTATLGLSRSFLAAGKYRVRLWGIAEGQQEKEIGAYPVEIRYL